MFKNLMNGVSLSALILRDANNDGGADPKEALREQLSKGNLPTATNVPPPEEVIEEEGEEEAEEDEEGEEEEALAEETEEQKKEREAKERAEAKAKRKEDRVQRRIDDAIAARKRAEEELAAFKNANPDVKLTDAEVEARAEAIANKKLAEKQLKDLQDDFNKKCDALSKEANKIDKNFDDTITDLAEDIGPIPSFMIGVLSDLDNGAAVLVHVAKDDELAEKIWKASPARQTKLLVDISNELAAAAKSPKKQISRVPDPGTVVKSNRVQSNVITEADAKNMDTYVAKRQKQMLEKRKAMGFG